MPPSRGGEVVDVGDPFRSSRAQPPERFRHRSRPTRPTSAVGKRFSVGDEVDARFQGKTLYRRGVIQSVNSSDSNVTYDILYPAAAWNGMKDEIERDVPSFRAREPAGRSRTRSNATTTRPSSNSGFQKGDKVEARYRGKQRFFSGVITEAQLDGKYAIAYDDGDKETDVPESFIRFRDGAANDTTPRGGALARQGLARRASDGDIGLSNKVYREGDKVEAQYRGKSRYYPGKIARDRGDNTYDIDYDDGEKEYRVSVELIRSVETKARGSSAVRSSFCEGEKIEARYRGKSRYYPGRIARTRDDGTFDIDYDDGEKEYRVEEELIRSLGAAVRTRGTRESAEPEIMKEGDKVEARYRGKSRYYPGKIARVRADGTYDIDYDDGEKEYRIDSEMIRQLESGDRDAPAATGRIEEGMKVEARYRGKSRYYPGRVKRANRDGTFDIDYDDGEKEMFVEASLVRPLEDLGRVSGAISGGGAMREGDKVEARYRGKSRYYPGKIARVNADGTYDIHYDDGDRDFGMAAEMVRSLEAGEGKDAPIASTGRIEEGMKVEARYRGKSRYYPGRVKRANRDGTFDIDYDDGEKEMFVEASLVRPLEDLGRVSGAISGGGAMREGDKVEARYRGKSRYYPGKIARVRADGTYDIDYDDGEKEYRIDSEMIRQLESGDRDAPAATGRIEEGMKVEARYRGKSRYYPGRVKRANRDGTFDIDYDDGEKEMFVEASLVRPLEDLGRVSGAISGGGAMREGDKVEARYRGKSRYYPGKIARVNADGTYDIHYDDGDRDFGMAAEMVRSLEAGEGKDAPIASTGRIEEGMKVEARYRGKSRYYPGRVKRANRDGTFDIDYDDGEKEMFVEASLVRPLEDLGRVSGAISGGGAMREGDKVEARYRGKSRYYPGKIARVRADGTYDIDYDDGEKEYRIDSEMIRQLESGDRDAPAATGRIEEGMKVEARYRGKSRYYPGKIARVRADGTYDIDYDDGEKEYRIDSEMIRQLESGDRDAPAATGRIEEGMKVEARYRGKSRYYPGRVKRANRDGTFDIDYDDGEKEMFVEASLVRPLEDLGHVSGAISGGGAMREGDKVEARYRGKSRYYPGKIARVNADGTYDIHYDDGDRDFGMAAEMVRSLEAGGGKDAPMASTGRIEEGMKVEARYRGKSRYYPGRVKRANRDGTFDIDYDDGEKEMFVEASLVRPLEDLGHVSGAISGGGAMREGDKVEARYRGKSRYYPGKIARVNADGTYDIHYDDGDRDFGMAAEMVRSLEAGGGKDAPMASTGRIEEGMKVEARYRGKSRYYPGRVKRANRDGTFDIDYDDGEKEMFVEASLVRPLEDLGRVSGAISGGGAMREGDKVEARYRGKSRYYPGKIARVRADGTYDIDYDDGEKEYRIDSEMIRQLESGDRDAPAATGRIEEGMKVEARYRGKSRYYPGRVKRANRDGTFDIDYDDGEKEMFVEASLVRPLEDLGRVSGAISGGGAMREGDKVEARYRGKSRYYPGKIARVNADGTYDIHYDDGDRDFGMAAEMVRSLEAGGGKDAPITSTGRIEEGMKVEARYRGKSRYYPGRVKRANRDGTFDIDYDDGEKEMFVEASLVRPLEDLGRVSGAISGGGAMREGDKVEARYRGKSRYYPGKIARVNADGTYDIHYDDGDRDFGMAAEMVRLADTVVPSDRSPSMGAAFREGDRIEGLFKGGTKWFAGRITRVNADNTYDVSYDDGDREFGVTESTLRPPGSSSPAAFKAGDRIEGRFRGGQKWYKGEITRTNSDGTYDVHYDDGDSERGVTAKTLRPLAGPARDSPVDVRDTRRPPEFREGDVVEADATGRGRWSVGRVSRVHATRNEYDITFDAGDREFGIPESRVRLAPRHPEPIRSTSPGGIGGRNTGYGGDRDPYSNVLEREGRRDDPKLSQREVELESALRETRDRLRSLERDRGSTSAPPPFYGGGMGGMGGGQAEFLMMQINDLQSKMGLMQGENMQLRASLNASQAAGAGFVPSPYAHQTMVAAAPPAGSMLRGMVSSGSRGSLSGTLQARQSVRPRRTNMFDEDFGEPEETILENELVRVGSQPGSLAEWLQAAATPIERQNLVDFVQLIEDWEFSRGLAPMARPREPDGCVTVRLGQALRVELRFKT